jgi:hypothetical protein
MHPAPKDLPFPKLPKKSHLQSQTTIDILLYDRAVVRCTWSNGSGSVDIPRPFLPFLVFLNCLNSELSNMGSDNHEKYWRGLRVYLNHLIDETMSHLQAQTEPKAITCWLQREFLMCRHDENGRNGYLRLTRSNGLQPYRADIFMLG